MIKLNNGVGADLNLNTGATKPILDNPSALWRSA